MKHKIILSTALLVAASTLFSFPWSSSRNGTASASQAGAIAASPWESDIAKATSTALSLHRDTLLLFANSATGAAPDPALSATLKEMVLCRVAPPDLQTRPQDTAITVWAERLNVVHTPELVLLDKEGRPYARASLSDENALTLSLVQQLEQMRSRRDELFSAAAKATGGAKAQLLDQGIALTGDFGATAYIPEMKQVVALDGHGSLGLREKYLPITAAHDLDEAIQQRIYPLVDRADFRGAVTGLDKLIADFGADAKQLDMLLAFKGQLLYSLGDHPGALKALDDALSCSSPGSPVIARIRAAKDKILAAE